MNTGVPWDFSLPFSVPWTQKNWKPLELRSDSYYRWIVLKFNNISPLEPCFQCIVWSNLNWCSVISGTFPQFRFPWQLVPTQCTWDSFANHQGDAWCNCHDVIFKMRHTNRNNVGNPLLFEIFSLTAKKRKICTLLIDHRICELLFFFF